MNKSDALWRQCGTWIKRNGVVLCQLANALDPNSIDLTKVIYFPPEDNSVEDFVCRNNIFLFVRSLVTHFHLDTEICFFDPPCLYEYQDIGKEHKLEKKLETEESLYSEVRSLYDKECPVQPTEYTKNHVIFYRKVGSLFSPKKSKRDHPIREMIDTERTYLDNLLMVRDCFRDRISLLDADTKNEIFYGLDEMIHLHSFLQRDLSVCEKDVGRVLLKYLNQFSVYKVYCTKLSSNQAFLQNQEKSNPKLNAELVRCRLEANSSFPLSAHIVIPFQRLLKYHLMLEGILKHTDSDHPHYCNLILAKEAFIELNKEINDLKGQMEKDEKLIQTDLQALTILEKVEKSIRCMHLPASSRLQEYGKMVRAGNLATHGHQGTADYAFLLHTIIIFATKPKILQHRFRFKFALKLKDYNIEHTGDCIKLTNTLNVFSSLILTTKRPSELRMWEHDLVECKSLIAPVNPRGHSLVLTNLPGKTCAHCYNKIVGALGQAYKCNTCDAAIHLSCLPDISWCHMANNDDFSFRRFGSMMLPIQLQGDRGSMGSTLSLACVNIDNKDTVRELRQEWSRERENIPLEAQPWFAGNLTSSTATTRLNSLPLATFLVRQRGETDNQYALAINTGAGVKHIKIEYEKDAMAGTGLFFFTDIHKFSSLINLIDYYREHDLGDVFNYTHMKGMKLNSPYKNV